MNEPIIPPAPRATLIRHKRERNLQILLPIIAVSVFIVAFCVLVVYATMQGGDAARWAAIAMICMIVPIMLVSLVVLVVIIGMIYGTGKVYTITPEYSGQATDYIKYAAVQTQHYANVASEPFIKIKSWLSVPQKMTSKEDQ